MSTKFDNELKNCRDIFNEEKEKFLDVLADFIATNRDVIRFSNQLVFWIKIIPDKANGYEFKYSLSVNSKDWEAPFIIGVALEHVINSLKEEYNISYTTQRAGELAVIYIRFVN